MSSFIETLISQFGDDAIKLIGQQIGADSDQTQGALSNVLPLIISALAKNTSDDEGAASLHNAVAKDHDGSILNMLDQFIPNATTEGAGSGILRHIFGDNRSMVEGLISQVSGLNGSSTAQLMETVAPIIMGFLGREQKEQNLDQNGLISLIQTADKETADHAPEHVNSIVTYLLDSDKDGSIQDDLASMAMNFLGSYFTRK
jgi:hypothetical protein